MPAPRTVMPHIETIDPEMLDRMPGFRRRMEWFIANRPDLISNVACMRTKGMAERRLLSVLTPDNLRRVLRYMLDEKEFLSPYGIRALPKRHESEPYTLHMNGTNYREYEPAESRSGLFGGNSNWRGPIWFPVNFLLVESLQRFHHYLGDCYKVETLQLDQLLDRALTAWTQPRGIGKLVRKYHGRLA